MKREENRNEYFPDSVTPAGTTILETINALNMTQVELAERTGRTPKTITGIISGKEPITPQTALQLEHALGIPAHFWMNRERRYREFLARLEEHERLERNLEWLKKFPVRAMIQAKWIHSCEDKVNQLREILNFFGVAAPEQWDKFQSCQKNAYRQSSAFESNPAAVAAWMRQGELQAQALQCKPYEASNFKEALKQIRRLTSERPEIFQPKVIELCAEAGVVVVFVPELPKTRLYGCSRWLGPNKALIQLSLRGKFNDQLWFTFFHEACHILQHGKKKVFIELQRKKKETFIDTDGLDNPEEAEANNFAANCLIPLDKWKNFLDCGRYSRNAVRQFADQMGVAAGIVVGRLQHEKLIPFSQLNKLKVRFVWAKGNATD